MTNKNIFLPNVNSSDINYSGFYQKLYCTKFLTISIEEHNKHRIIF